MINYLYLFRELKYFSYNNNLLDEGKICQCCMQFKIITVILFCLKLPSWYHEKSLNLFFKEETESRFDTICNYVNQFCVVNDVV